MPAGASSQPSGSRRLAAADREFFARFTRIIFANPFSEEGEALVSELVGARAASRADPSLSWLVPELDARLARLREQGLTSFRQASGEDGELLRWMLLYQTYHRYIPALNEVIENQLRSASVGVPFAERLISELGERGFTEQEALHYVAIFFQLRRAFNFIVRSLVGESRSMRRLRLALWNNVFTADMRVYDQHLSERMEDFSTLLLGETGTGKGSAAAAIGRSGFIPFDRAKGRFAVSFTESFIATNLSQFPETLIESELFGHRKGAFTGAVEDHKGLLEHCSRFGALFIDEIGEVSVPVQIKLLQVLQDRSFTPVGSHQQKRFAGRVIAATNRSLAELRSGSRFRDDFFYRLCSDVITMPTLRKRLDEEPAELERLVKELIERLTGEEDDRLADLVLRALERDLPRNYPWPGNVRELEQAVRRVLLTHAYAGDLKRGHQESGHALQGELDAGALSAREVMARYCALLYERLGTMEEVARRTGLDRRTVKKHLQERSGTKP